MRFSYDNTKLQPSSIESNVITDDETQYFKFENEFENVLEMFTIPDDAGENVIRGIISFNPPVVESEHIIEKDGIGKVVNTDGGVLLGKMSFQMVAEEFDVNWFNLVTDENSSPVTGIKINTDGTKYYEAQSTFRFIDETASKDASLSNLIVSTGIIDEILPENSTYKEYAYTPSFNKEVLNYELELLEYIDKINIKAITTDENATMKINIPKRDVDNNLVYDVDGTTIIYEEKDIQSEIPLEIYIGELGEPDKKITIVVTAEDEKTVLNYELVIKRPYGTIKGSIQLGENLREKAEASNGIYVEYIADIKVYNTGVFNWEDVITSGSGYSALDAETILKQIQSDKDDGSFELLLIPGTYDVLMEKMGFTQEVNKQIILNQNDVIDIGNHILHEGDVNRDGIVDISDLTTIVSYNGQSASNPAGSYSDIYDFQKKGYIDISDITSVASSLTLRRQLVINN